MIALAFIGGYLIVTLVIGVVANRRAEGTLEDFLLYGRKASLPLLFLTMVATYHSAFAFLGSSGFFYKHGIGFWVAGTWTILVGAITYTYGVRIWRLGKRFGYITPADLLADAYESETVRLLVASISIVFSILYIQVQAQGLGYIISVASENRITFEAGTAILLTVAALYLMMGGLRAVYWTDALQGVWMYVAVWAGALAITYHFWASPADMLQQVAAVRPELLTVPGPHGFFTWPMWLGLGLVLSFGVVLQPHLFIRFYTADSERTLKWLGATIPIYLLTLFIPTALIGLGGALILPDLQVPDRIFPELLIAYVSPWLTGIILAGATAAAMSTLDSILHANSTVLTRDIYQRYIRPEATREHYIMVSRAFVLALLVIGYLLSLGQSGYLVIIVTLSGAGALQLLPSVTAALFPSPFWRLTAAGVTAGIVAGLATLVVTLLVWPHPLTLHGGVWSTAINWIVALVVSRWTRPVSAATAARFAAALQSADGQGQA